MKRTLSLLLTMMFAALCVACGNSPPPDSALPEPTDAAEALHEGSSTVFQEPEPPSPELPAHETGAVETEVTNMEQSLHLTINDTEVSVIWEDNKSVEALIDLVSSAPLTVQMSMYGGFEQVGALGRSLPRDDSQTTTQAGDIVLYSGSQIVVFYGSNSWAYTRLGRIADKSVSELSELLGNGDVTITLSLE